MPALNIYKNLNASKIAVKNRKKYMPALNIYKNLNASKIAVKNLAKLCILHHQSQGLKS
jgi:hypothetical protein